MHVQPHLRRSWDRRDRPLGILGEERREGEKETKAGKTKVVSVVVVFECKCSQLATLIDPGRPRGKPSAAS